MTDKKIREILALYQEKFAEYKVVPEQFRDDRMATTNFHGQMAHVCQMLDRIKTFLDEGKRDKASLWLGFVQGVLWSEGVYTLHDLKSHNSSADDSAVMAEDVCPGCGAPPREHEVRDHSLMWHDGKVYCRRCGTFVRRYDAG